MDVGVNRESNSGVFSAGVVELTGDVADVVDRALLANDVVHGGDG
jgi:hypothetical protein